MAIDLGDLPWALTAALYQ